jgi:hypothetical protein
MAIPSITIKPKIIFFIFLPSFENVKDSSESTASEQLPKSCRLLITPFLFEDQETFIELIKDLC